MKWLIERIPHAMAVTKTIDVPSNLLFFDTETRGEINKEDMKEVRHRFFMGYVYACRYVNGVDTRVKEQLIQSIDSFWKFLFKRLDLKRPLYCFAHNLPFDLTILNFWNLLDNENIEIDFAVMEDPPTIILIRVQKCKIYFIDTLNYWRLSLKEIGKSVGLEKTEMPSEVKDSQEWIDYCKNDVMILKMAVTKLMDWLMDNDLGSFGFSTPSIAMKIFKHRFLKPNQLYIHDNRNVLAMEREAYYGGYTANFFIGKVKSKVYYVDINSMYPYVMQNKFPVKYIRSDNNPRLRDFYSLSRQFGCCATLEINDGTNAYPKRLEEKLCYVKGHYITTLCGAELLRARDNDSIKSVLKASYYQMQPLFREFVEYFYGMRLKYKKSNDKTGDYFTKLIMNSLYGKFGQLGYRWQDLTKENLRAYYDRLDLPFPDTYEKNWQTPDVSWVDNKWYAIGLSQPISIRAIHGIIQMKFPIGEHYESCPIISAYVTSYARELLQSYIAIAGKHNVLYCDTDSLFVNARGYGCLKNNGCINQSILGKLKLESSTRIAEFWGPKDYVFNRKVTLKGIRNDAIPLGDNEFMQNRFEGLKSILKRGGDAYVTIEWTNKVLSRKYTKGNVDKKGRVTEFVIDEFA